MAHAAPDACQVSSRGSCRTPPQLSRSPQPRMPPGFGSVRAVSSPDRPYPTPSPSPGSAGAAPPSPHCSTASFLNLYEPHQSPLPRGSLVLSGLKRGAERGCLHPPSTRRWERGWGGPGPRRVPVWGRGAERGAGQSCSASQPPPVPSKALPASPRPGQAQGTVTKPSPAASFYSKARSRMMPEERNSCWRR